MTRGTRCISAGPSEIGTTSAAWPSETACIRDAAGIHDCPSGRAMIELVWPVQEHLASYIDALERGWSPDNTRPEAGREELARIREDPALFLAQQVDREGRAPPVTLPDGSTVARLRGYRRWMWDGEFCGAIGFRWQPGTTELPPYCLGHIGFAVVPWKRRRGYATRALTLLLPDARREGLA